jgi:hypothetical protein
VHNHAGLDLSLIQGAVKNSWSFNIYLSGCLLLHDTPQNLVASSSDAISFAQESSIWAGFGRDRSLNFAQHQLGWLEAQWLK